jgi:hypothetical protein
LAVWGVHSSFLGAVSSRNLPALSNFFLKPALSPYFWGIGAVTPYILSFGIWFNGHRRACFSFFGYRHHN